MNDENNVVIEENNNESKTLSFDEMLGSNKEYQSEFDRRLAKSNKTALENAKSTWEKEFTEKLEREKSEAEKLAKMNVEQQLQYRIEQLENKDNVLAQIKKPALKFKEEAETTINVLYNENKLVIYTNKVKLQKELNKLIARCY